MKAVILDFDGTIADTQNSIIQAIQATLQELQLPFANKKTIKELIGLPLKDTFEKAAHIEDQQIMEKAIITYRKLYSSISFNNIDLFPNVKNTLKILHKKGTIITVASSKGKDALQKLLDKLEISQFITLAFGEQDVKNKKPAPDMVVQILNKIEVKPCETIVVGDTIYDIEMGQRAECITCGVTYGNHLKAQLEQQRADYIIDNFAELLNIIA